MAEKKLFVLSNMMFPLKSDTHITSKFISTKSLTNLGPGYVLGKISLFEM